MRVGFEPTVRINPHKGFQDLRHSPLGHLTWAESAGVEPTDRLRGHGLANHCLSRSAYSPGQGNYIRNELGTQPSLRYNTHKYACQRRKYIKTGGDLG